MTSPGLHGSLMRLMKKWIAPCKWLVISFALLNECGFHWMSCCVLAWPCILELTYDLWISYKCQRWLCASLRFCLWEQSSLGARQFWRIIPGYSMWSYLRMAGKHWDWSSSYAIKLHYERSGKSMTIASKASETETLGSPTSWSIWNPMSWASLMLSSFGLSLSLLSKS